MRATALLAFASASIAFVVGAGSGREAPAASTSTEQAAPEPTPAPPLPLPPTVTVTAARTSPHVTADVPLSPEDQAVLTQDPAREAAREVDETRAMRRAQCKRAVPEASDAYCERILAANGHAIEHAIAIKQRFLRGEIDQDTFQSEYHKVFLERSIELEQFMSARDYLAHEHFPPGDDLFVAMLAGPKSTRTAHVGTEILDPEATQPMDVSEPATTEGEKP
jgi:hypothetical protein